MVENIITKEKYIGQKHSNIFLGNKYLGSGNIIKQKVKEYGKDKFKVILLTKCYSQQELDKQERYFISKYAKNNDLYNIAEGGMGGSVTKYMTTEQYQIHCNRNTKSKTYKENMSKTITKLWQNDEYKKHMQEIHSGKKQTQETINKRIAKTKGKKRTNEFKQKISQLKTGNKNCLGKHHTDNTKQILSKNMLGRKLMNNGIEMKYIKPDEIEIYENAGWKRGKLNG